jgi:hypothetical protein
MMRGVIQSQNVHLNGFGVYVQSRATDLQSHQRRFRRWLSNRRIDILAAHHASDLVVELLPRGSINSVKGEGNIA